jgi:hypothetical protein
MDEYEQTIKLRELWTRSIMIWGQVLIPLGASIISFFIYLTAEDGFSSNDFDTMLIGWFLFAVCMLYWRWIVHHIDEQIIELYPVIIRLESEKRWETNTRYFYNNLSEKSKKRLTHELGLESLPRIYDDFVDEVSKKSKVRKVSEKGFDHYSLLLDCWRRYGVQTISDRGHKVQDMAVDIIIALLLFLVLLLIIGIWAWMPSLILFLSLLYWRIKRYWGRLV